MTPPARHATPSTRPRDSVPQHVINKAQDTNPWLYQCQYDECTAAHTSHELYWEEYDTPYGLFICLKCLALLHPEALTNWTDNNKRPVSLAEAKHAHYQDYHEPTKP